MEPGVRGYVVKFLGKDGSRCSVAFDRYRGYAGITEGQAISNALVAVMREKGDDWIESYKVQVVPSTR